MMRLALAATMFQAAAAVATCTVQSCCVDMVQGMCSGNTHDAAGKATGDVGVTSTEITAVSCTGATPENKGATQAGRDEVACCQAATAAPAALATCGDVNGDATGTTAVSATECGAGWIVDASATAATCTGTACDFATEADKVACCSPCSWGTFALAADVACSAHGAGTAAADCPIGQGWSGSTTADDGACADCAAGKYTAGTTTEECLNCSGGSQTEHPSGTAIALAASACTSCAANTNDGDIDSSTACATNVVTTCAAGEGFTQGTTTADGTCAACVVGATFNAATDSNPCASSVIACAILGEGNVASTAADAANTCGSCPVSTYAAETDTGYCLSDCADGNIIDLAADANVAVAVGGERCTACAAGNFDDDGIPSSACVPHATTPVTACGAGEGFTAASVTADAHCTACAVNTFTAGVGTESCAGITATACAAGKGYASDATASSDDTAAACTDCPAGKFTAGTAQEVCMDCGVGEWSPMGASSCTACASGLTTAAVGSAAATACVANSAYCLEATIDDDSDTETTTGEPFVCGASKYVAQNVQTAAVDQVAQCTAVPATGDAITADRETTCHSVAAADEVTAVTAIYAGTTIVLSGADTTVAADDAVAYVPSAAGVDAECIVTSGSGTCTFATPVPAVAPTDTTCPEPDQDSKVSGAAAAAPLAAFAALVAALA